MKTYGYLVELLNKVSEPMRAVQRSVQAGQETFKLLTQQVHGADQTIQSLSAHAQMLRQSRNLVESSEVEKIRAYNLALKQTEGQIRSLENINGGAFSKLANQASMAFPHLALLSNPIVAVGAGLYQGATLAVGFEKGLAKVNTTAGLSSDKLEELGDRLQNYGVSAGYSDIGKIPDAFEKILGVTNDVAQSEDILKVALKGASAGFADVDVVGGALANTMGALGKNSGYTAEQIGDILFAAKRVGAGDFQDFASNLPALVPIAKELGFSLQETAGAFAFFTAKGNSAADSTTLMKNLFTAFNKSEVLKGFEKVGVSVEDATGKTKPLIDIISQLQEKLQGKSLTERSSILNQMGLHDAQANQAIAVLINDTDKLKEALTATSSPWGELTAAFGNSGNTIREIGKLWSTINSILLDLGSIVIPPLNLAVQGLAWIFGGLGKHLGAVGIAGLGVVFATSLMTTTINGTTRAGWLQVAWSKAQVLWAGLVAIANGGLTLSFGAAGAAIIAFNGAVYSIPIVGWILAAVAAIGALIFSVATMYENWIGFRAAVNGVFSVAGELFMVLWNITRLDFTAAAKGIERVMSGKAYFDARNATIQRTEKKESVPGQPDSRATSDSDQAKQLMNGAVKGSTEGGNRATQVTFNLGNVVETINIMSDGFETAAEDMEGLMTEHLFRAFNMAMTGTTR